MIEIALGCAGQRAHLALDPAQQAWSRQSAGAEFAFVKNSGLPAPFGALFVKRLAKDRAPAHGLLLSTLERPLRSTPIFFGYAPDGAWHYYVYNRLERVTGLEKIFSASEYRQDQYITRGLVTALLNNTTAVFAEINRRGYFYPDFCYRNLMGNPTQPAVLVIDMDSCYPLAGRLPGAVRVDQTWWRMPLRYAGDTPRWLNPGMVLGMAVVLCRALAAFECEPGVTNLATSVLAGRPEDQDLLFDLLERGDGRALRELYHVPARRAKIVSGLFADWQAGITAMRRNATPDWQLVRRVTQGLLAASGRGADKT